METPTTEERAPKILGRGVKKLACNLTDAELLERGQKIAAVKQELDNHIEQTKATAKTMSARKAELDAEVSSIATALGTKQEMRDVEYREEADFISGRAVTIRNDTNATLTSRPLTPDERQERLFGEGATEKTIPDRPEEVPPEPLTYSAEQPPLAGATVYLASNGQKGEAKAVTSEFGDLRVRVLVEHPQGNYEKHYEPSELLRHPKAPNALTGDKVIGFKGKGKKKAPEPDGAA